MVNQKRKMIKIFVVFFLLIVVVSAILFYKRMTFHPYNEVQIKHEIPGSGSYFKVYKYTPKIVIKKTKEFLKENGFCGANIHFIFLNKYYSSQKNDEFTFHVKQYYKDLDCSGYFKINLHGEIEIIHNLKTADELSLIQTESDIDYVDAFEIAINYLDLKEYTEDGSQKMLYFDPSSQKWICVYDMRFEGQTIELIIDGITGEILKEIRGEDVIRGWN